MNEAISRSAQPPPPVVRLSVAQRLRGMLSALIRAPSLHLQPQEILWLTLVTSESLT